ncbi:hypothetical protein BDW59DRAFT_163283 [Aspergillus cavernicola]|uniref:LysM domain-containing protein n=1 Tax=Aspergillus cavernicola TaxID=176166 RepID=A0ABR4I6X8_9EURO
MFSPNLFLILLLIIIATSAGQGNVVSKPAPPSETSPSTPTRPGTLPNCSQWYTVKLGDTCGEITEWFGISLDDFYHWNPTLKADCVNMWAKYAYCVGVRKGTQPVPTSTTTSTPISTGSSGSTTSASTSTSTSTVESSTTPNIPTSEPTSGSYTVINPITSFTPIARPTSTTAAWPPTKTQPGQPPSWNKWHLVRVGDNCDTIQARYAVWTTFDEV